MVGKNVNTREIVSSLPGYNMRATKRPKNVWNTDFQSFEKPMAYRVLEQDKKGGAGIIMLGALVLGLIIAACAGVL